MMTTNTKPIPAIKGRPILFTGEMVKAILEGRKTQTRRAIKPQPSEFKEGPLAHERKHPSSYIDAYNGGPYWAWWTSDNRPGPQWKCPHGKVGDRLWVRETFAIESNWNLECDPDYPPPFNDGRPVKRNTCPEYGSYWEQCHYRATDSKPDLSYDDLEGPSCRWKPSIHMPRWASRLTLEITDIRVEHLQCISQNDCCSEGVVCSNESHQEKRIGCGGIKGEFAKLWNQFNEKQRFRWEKNPWVWCLTFKVL